jgi:2-oxoglutarate ferredoxin oxidoreductase subunit alpha
MSDPTVSLAISGSGGAGVVLVGQLLLRAAGRHGLFGLMHRSAGPQIRGGESLVMLRFAASEVACQDDGFQWLFALDWKNFERFSAEVPLFGDARVFADDKAGPAPAAVGRDAEVLELSALAQGIDGGRPNMVLLGRLARGLGIPRDGVDAELEQRMGGRGEAPLAAARACVAAGY